MGRQKKLKPKNKIKKSPIPMGKAQPKGRIVQEMSLEELYLQENILLKKAMQAKDALVAIDRDIQTISAEVVKKQKAREEEISKNKKK